VNSDHVVLLSQAGVLWDKDFILSADIDLSRTMWANPVIRKFTGAFDGNGFVIKNLTITGRYRCGFFGELEEGASLKNVRIEDVIVAGTDQVGGLVGFSEGAMVYCRSIGIVSGEDEVGGLVGSASGTIVGCSSIAAVIGDDSVGGLVGANDGAISHCHSVAEAIGSDQIGGLVGANATGGTVTDCDSAGAVVSCWGTRGGG